MVRYEGALLWKGMRAAFSRPEDVALLVLMGLVAAAYLSNAEMGGGSRWSRGFILAAMAPWILAFSWERLLQARLRHFMEETPLAGDAIEERPRFAYRVTAHALVLTFVLVPYIALLGYVLGNVARTAALGGLAYTGGSLMASLPWPARFGNTRSYGGTEHVGAGGLCKGRTTLLRLILRTQVTPLKPGIPAAIVLIGGSGTLAFLVARLMPADRMEAATALALFPSFLLILASGRMDYSTMRLLPFAGYSPAAVAASVALFPAALAAAAALGGLLSASSSSFAIAVGAGLMLAVFLPVAVARCWLYGGSSRRSADLQVQVEFVALLLLLLFIGPLAAIAALWRLATFYRAHGRLQWQHP